ncbi:uncharacterized protein LOC134860825 [Eleginops maclovinus]|uniref:uncharacterized protein LOC134860825 n=1 Tax=Eleginops maclovinus TaxID=56733 RepID=UPI0030809830
MGLCSVQQQRVSSRQERRYWSCYHQCAHIQHSVTEISDPDEEQYQCDFLLDLYSHLKDCETETCLSVLPSVQSVFQSSPAVWCIDLSERKTSFLLEVLKLQPEKKQVELRGCSDIDSEVRTLLQCLPYISQLSADRNLLLRMVHHCAASAQQGAAEALLRTVQHRLDLSCSSCVELSEEDQSDTLHLTAGDCRAVSTVLRRCRQETQLILQDCEVQDSGLDLLFPVLHTVILRYEDQEHLNTEKKLLLYKFLLHIGSLFALCLLLRASKAVLLQLVSLVPVNNERDTVGRAVSLCRALEGELDLSHSTLDQRACASLALILDFSEGLTELDLSHCQLTDQLLLTLSAQLHKAQVLDLSHNNLTDASTDLLLQLVSINPSIHTVL